MKELRACSSERGFTLIELLTIIAIIGVLSGLGIASFKVYKGDAAYTVTEAAIRNARNAIEAGINADTPPGAVGLVAQNVPGPINDTAASVYLPSFQLPKNVRMQVQYDPTCTSSACYSDMIELSHCFAHEYTRWVRQGDGLDFLIEHIAGGGC